MIMYKVCTLNVSNERANTSFIILFMSSSTVCTEYIPCSSESVHAAARSCRLALMHPSCRFQVNQKYSFKSSRFSDIPPFSLLATCGWLRLCCRCGLRGASGAVAFAGAAGGARAPPRLAARRLAWRPARRPAWRPARPLHHQTLVQRQRKVFCAGRPLASANLTISRKYLFRTG
jgi:hypothetical protein